MIQNTTHTETFTACLQCGSALILVSQETVQPEGTRYPQINTVYVCSNDICQQKKQKDKEDREKLRQKREASHKEKK